MVSKPKYRLLMEEKHQYRVENKRSGQLQSIVYRIQALRSFANVREGDLGGLIAKEENLSHAGNCWVNESGVVYSNACVKDNAYIRGLYLLEPHGSSLVKGDYHIRGADGLQTVGCSVIAGDAVVGGDTVIFASTIVGNARVTGGNIIQSKVYEDAVITGGHITLSKIHGDVVIEGYCNIKDAELFRGYFKGRID